jgi:hypothetical protein
VRQAGPVVNHVKESSSCAQPTVQVPVTSELLLPFTVISATPRSWYWNPGGTLNEKVQPAWPQVYSAEPADCQGELAEPASGTHPLGLSHWAVKRTCMSPVEPSPATWARTPSCEGLQMLTFAQEEVSCSDPAVPGTTKAAAAATLSASARLGRARHDRFQANGISFRGTRCVLVLGAPRLNAA